MTDATYGAEVDWRPEKLRFKPLRLLVAWLIAALSVNAAAAVLSGFVIKEAGGNWILAALIGILNALVPPLIAAIRLPFALGTGFLLLLVINTWAIHGADAWVPQFVAVDSWATAFNAALLIAGVRVILEVITGTNDDGQYALRVIRRVARKQGVSERTDKPGIIFLEIDGLAAPILRRAMRDGNAPVMARWLAEGHHRLASWEPDLSSQTGASQAGILLGSNENIPAFRWVEKATGRVVSCSSPGDCAEIEQRCSTGIGLLANGGASRGNLLSGDADEVILTVSRMDAEKGANPGYRAFFSNGFNVTRSLALFVWELLLEWSAAIRARRRDVQPRGHRGGIYPFLRAVMCVLVRDIVVYGVLTDMMRGRPAVYATFASYDEVAHHSGLERHDTLEALRKVDQQFGRIASALKYAPRPYEIVVLSDHGQTQGATFLQRNGYALSDLVERSLQQGSVADVSGGDEQAMMAGLAVGEATGGGAKDFGGGDVDGSGAVVLGSGNLGLVYLMEEPRRLTLEEIEQRHPQLLPALREHPHIDWLLVRSAEHGAVALGGAGIHYLEDGRVEGEDPLAHFSANAPRHLLRTDGFADVADIMVGSFYDPVLDEGCAFEELISFHGGLGGEQTEPFLLYPSTLALPDEPLVGAAAVHGVLSGWRRELHGS